MTPTLPVACARLSGHVLPLPPGHAAMLLGASPLQFLRGAHICGDTLGQRLVNLRDREKGIRTGHALKS
eukprot:1137798-Pelagomonas_calceolata.AAC.2